MKAYILNPNTLVASVISDVLKEWILADSITNFSESGHLLKVIVDDLPDLVVTCATLAESDGLDYVPEMRSRNPRGAIVVFTRRRDPRTLSLFRRMPGVSLVDAESTSLTALRAILSDALDGRIVRSLSLRGALEEAVRWKRDLTLSPREEYLLSILGTGMSNEEAADVLGIPAATVRGIRGRIMAKLSIHHKGDLVRYAICHYYVRMTPEGRVLYPGFMAAHGRQAVCSDVPGR